MSRFFATGGSDSESDTDSEREQVVARPAPATFTVISSSFILFYFFSIKKYILTNKNAIISV